MSIIILKKQWLKFQKNELFLYIFGTNEIRLWFREVSGSNLSKSLYIERRKIRLNEYRQSWAKFGQTHTLRYFYASLQTKLFLSSTFNLHSNEIACQKIGYWNCSYFLVIKKSFLLNRRFRVKKCLFQRNKHYVFLLQLENDWLYRLLYKSRFKIGMKFWLKHVIPSLTASWTAWSIRLHESGESRKKSCMRLRLQTFGLRFHNTFACKMSRRSSTHLQIEIQFAINREIYRKSNL